MDQKDYINNPAYECYDYKLDYKNNTNYSIVFLFRKKGVKQ